MLNPDYDPDRAHLPNAEDKRRQRFDGYKKLQREKVKLEAFKKLCYALNPWTRPTTPIT